MTCPPASARPPDAVVTYVSASRCLRARRSRRRLARAVGGSGPHQGALAGGAAPEPEGAVGEGGPEVRQSFHRVARAVLEDGRVRAAAGRPEEAAHAAGRQVRGASAEARHLRAHTRTVARLSPPPKWIFVCLGFGARDWVQCWRERKWVVFGDWAGSGVCTESRVYY